MLSYSFLRWCIHGWKVVASLKGHHHRRPDRPASGCIHGWKVVASLKDRALCSEASCETKDRIHGWKVVASLKVAVGLVASPVLLAPSIHGWKVVASLKEREPIQVRRDLRRYPRLEGRGLIEGGTSRRCLVVGGGIHGWKVVASLKVDYDRPMAARPAMECIHGWKVVASLKELHRTGRFTSLIAVSTAGRSWPH